MIKYIKLIKLLLILISLLQITFSCETKTPGQTEYPKKDWWENAQFYQIYPRSFKDSNGDGIGDLNGITQNLQYLKDIGITAAWLSPIYKSPMVDFGYDIENFYEIQPEYGTMTDFDNLIKKANEIGMKIILDFVPNHSSDKSEWFQKSIKREKGYENFYVWHPGKPNVNDPSKPLPPSNWLSSFRGSAWEWNDERKEYYLHQFAKEQPDLNYRNPAVVERMKHVLRFWLHKGVAGFRVDTLPSLYEVKPDENGDYPDEPKSGGGIDDNDPDSLKHIYTQDQPETLDMAYQWRKVLDDYARVYGGDTRVLLIETWSPLDFTMKFYGNRTVNGAQVPFNFKFIQNSKLDGLKASDFIDNVNYWMKNLPPRRVPNWVLGNHDSHRVGTRYGENRIDIMEMVQMMLPGISVTYMGEEIGMIDGEISREQNKDPAAATAPDEASFKKLTRDPERTPFQWDDTQSAGFSTSTTTWLPVASNYREVNVKAELAATKSHLKVFKSLVALRGTTDTLKYGDYNLRTLNNDNVLVLERFLKNKPTLILVANINDGEQTINLAKSTLPAKLTVQVASVNSDRNVKDSVEANSITLKGYESLVLSS